jgi:hypothetical protein
MISRAWGVRLTSLTVAVLGVGLAGCGRIGFGDRAAPCASDATAGCAAAIAVQLPPTASVLPEATLVLAARVDGTTNQAVTWSIDEAAGAITAAGVLTAPATAQTLHVRATSAAAPTVSAMTTVTVSQTLAVAELAAVGTSSNATGMSHQAHLVYAPELGQWWMWYGSTLDPTHLRTRFSSDFVSWRDGEALALGHPHGGDGRNLAVADAVIGGHHVVHLSAGYLDAKRGRVHARAELTAGRCAFGAAQEINAGGVQEPDGPAVAITADGHVVDVTGWLATPQRPPLTPCGDGDDVFYSSDLAETGTTSFDAMTYTQEVLWCVPTRIDARWLYADGNDLYELYDDAISDPDPRNLLMTVRKAGTWLPDETVYTMPPRVFATDQIYPLDDWGVAVVGRGIHAARRVGATFEHRVYDLDAGGAWRDGPALPGAAGKAGAGLFLAPYGAGLIAVQIAATADQAIAYSYGDGARWTPWRSLTSAMAGRGFIAGAVPAGGGRPAITWTEDRGGGTYAIAGGVLP